MAKVRLPTEQIADFEPFHTTCQQAFGFPHFYGMNMNAWIDCLTDLDVSHSMSHVELAQDEVLCIEVANTNEFKTRVADVFAALVEGSAAVNQRSVDDGTSPRLALVFL